MRLAIVATPGLLSDRGRAPGALDGALVRARLRLSDARFTMVDVDPAIDVAEQLESLFDASKLGKDNAVLFYASCIVALADDGELFLCLDATQPETGDSLRDIAAVLRDRVRGPALVVLECRHSVDDSDPFRSALVVTAAKEAVDPASTQIGLLVAARPAATGPEQDASHFTRAFIQSLDAAGLARSVTVDDAFAWIEQSEMLVGVVPSFAHAAGRLFELVPRGSTAPESAHVSVTQPQVAADTKDVAPSRESQPESALERQLDVERHEERADDGALAAEGIDGEPAERAQEPGSPAQPNGAPDALDADESPNARTAVEPPPPSRTSSLPPTALPEARSFLRAEPSLPRVIVSTPPPLAPTGPPSVSGHIAASDATSETDPEAALSELKQALAVLAPSSPERADVYVRIGNIKSRQEKRREAISNFEKALHLLPDHRVALESLIRLDVEEADWKAVHGAEERLLAMLSDPKERFARLVEFGARWQDLAHDDARARLSFEQAQALRPDDLGVLGRLQRLYEAAGDIDRDIATRRNIAERTSDPTARAQAFAALGDYCLFEQKRDELGFELFDLALETDPGLLEPLETVARVLAERQEYAELERTYRKMLDRVQRIPEALVRAEVSGELWRRLGLLYRDHLEDPSLALEAFEEALAQKSDVGAYVSAAELARGLDEPGRAAGLLQAAARADASREATFHELFELFQRLRQPDQAYGAACATMYLGCAEPRERFVFEEHKSEGVPKLERAMRREAWDLLRVDDRDRVVESILETITGAAIQAKLSQLADEGRLPNLDPSTRQDPQQTTVSVVRSFAWASHFLGLVPPAVYLRDDPAVNLIAVPAEEPTVVAGGGILRGKSLADLAFLVGRHVAYYMAPHRILLFYPSLEELSACFVAGVKTALPDAAVPAPLEGAIAALVPELERRLSDEQRADLELAAAEFEAVGKRADLPQWVGAVERCATRTGLLLCDDLAVTAAILRSDPRGLVAPEDKINDLLAFVVSDAYHTLRQELGIAVEP